MATVGRERTALLAATSFSTDRIVTVRTAHEGVSGVAISRERPAGRGDFTAAATVSGKSSGSARMTRGSSESRNPATRVLTTGRSAARYS